MSSLPCSLITFSIACRISASFENVGDDQGSSAARRSDFFDRFADVFFGATENVDDCALGGEQFCRRFADAAPRPRHECDLPFNSDFSLMLISNLPIAAFEGALQNKDGK